MRRFADGERRARPARRHHLASDIAPESVETLARDLVGLHATDPATPYLSLWARIPGFSIDHLDDRRRCPGRSV